MSCHRNFRTRRKISFEQAFGEMFDPTAAGQRDCGWHKSDCGGRRGIIGNEN
jgi:hypothetical protein